MAKIDFKKVIFKNIAEEPIPRPDPTPENKERTVEATMADVIQAELLREDPTGLPTERFESYLIAKRIKKGSGEIDLTVEELALIKKISGKNPNPLIVGRIWEMIEDLESKKEISLKE